MMQPDEDQAAPEPEPLNEEQLRTRVRELEAANERLRHAAEDLYRQMQRYRYALRNTSLYIGNV